jgi:TolB-like protein/DNA-binding winged helix-turn-helix (wHTH) protein
MDTKAGRKDAETSPNARRQTPHPGSEPARASPGPVPAVYRFAGFTLDTRRQLLVRGSAEMRLRPRTYDVLAYLVMHPGRLVGKPELMDAVWEGVAVTDDSLVQCLMEIRRALGEAHDVVKTVRGRGYLLDGEVHVVGEDDVRSREAEPSGVGAQDTSRRVAEAVSARARQRGFRAAFVASALLVVGIAATVSRFQLRGPDGVFAPAPTVPIRSLAVLPLENLSRDAEQEYFADGMTDELITQLAKISALRVISRTSVMRFKSARKPLAEIARELHVDAVVEGTVVRSGDRVRVTAQVIQANPEMHLWAERYDRSLGDSVTMQGELAREISRAIRVKLTTQEQSRLADVRRVDREAYEALLKGRFYWNKRTEAATQTALAYFQHAIDKDPTDAMAFTGLADSYVSLALTEALQEVLAPREAFPKARAAVDRALQIDDTLAEPHASLAHIKFQYERDWLGAEKEFKRAIELNPNYANAHHWYALCLGSGRFMF